MQFYATDHDIEKLLRGSLSPEYRPYSLVGFDRIHRGPRVYDWRPFECSVADFIGCREGPEERRNKWFIRSHVLTPHLPESDVSDQREWSLNGLIDVLHGFRRGNKQTESSIGMAPVVRNITSGQEIRHRGYEAVFAGLRSSLKVQARHPILRTFPDGTMLVDSTLALMTDEARQLALREAAFDVEPAD